MKIESPAFTDADLDAFLAEARGRDRVALAERLETASVRLATLVGRIGAPRAAPSGGWSAREILAHIAGLSKYYGVVAYRVGSGRATEVDLLADVRERDCVAQGLVAQSPTERLAAIQADHRRTLDWLRSAEPAALARRADLGGGRTLSAEEILRLGLCAHLEIHLDQLEASLVDERPPTELSGGRLSGHEPL
jgi:hypothetical protein